MEAIAIAPFSCAQLKILLELLRLTFGWRKRTVTVSHSDLAERVGLALSGGFREALAELIRERVVLQLERGSGHRTSTFAIQKDFSQWGRFAIAPARLRALFDTRPESRDDLMESASAKAHASLESASRQAVRVPRQGYSAPLPEGTACRPNDRSRHELGRPKEIERNETKKRHHNGTNGLTSVALRDELDVDSMQAFQAIRRLTRSNGVAPFIPFPEVERLGTAAVQAYRNVGGADRFIHATPEQLGFLQADFRKAYRVAASRTVAELDGPSDSTSVMA